MGTSPFHLVFDRSYYPDNYLVNGPSPRKCRHHRWRPGMEERRHFGVRMVIPPDVDEGTDC